MAHVNHNPPYLLHQFCVKDLNTTCVVKLVWLLERLGYLGGRFMGRGGRVLKACEKCVKCDSEPSDHCIPACL